MSAKTIRKPAIDRRSARTRRLLHQALMQLILGKPYDSITVQQIIDEADVARATFYAHYAGKDDLLRRGFDHLRSELLQAKAEAEQASDVPRLSFLKGLFDHADRYKLVYRGLLGTRASPIVLNEFRKLIVEMVRPEVSTSNHPEISRELLAHFIADGVQSVVTWWVERQPDLPATSAHTMCRDLLNPVLLTSRQQSSFEEAA